MGGGAGTLSLPTMKALNANGILAALCGLLALASPGPAVAGESPMEPAPRWWKGISSLSF